MSDIITFETNAGMWTCNMQLPEPGSSSRFTHWNNKLPVVKEEEDDDSSSSSIGVNSDSDADVADGEEVTTKDDSGAFSGLNELEAALPIKRGISKFYDGKSKSYDSLADAAEVSSIQEIVKKEDAYSRKRKNMIANTVLLEKLCSSSSENGVPKRLARSIERKENAKKSSLMVGGGHPLLYRNRRKAVDNGSLDASRGVYRAPRRSFSLSDIMSGISGLVSSKSDKKV